MKTDRREPRLSTPFIIILTVILTAITTGVIVSSYEKEENKLSYSENIERTEKAIEEEAVETNDYLGAQMLVAYKGNVTATYPVAADRDLYFSSGVPILVIHKANYSYVDIAYMNMLSSEVAALYEELGLINKEGE